MESEKSLAQDPISESPGTVDNGTTLWPNGATWRRSDPAPTALPRSVRNGTVPLARRARPPSRLALSIRSAHAVVSRIRPCLARPTRETARRGLRRGATQAYRSGQRLYKAVWKRVTTSIVEPPHSRQRSLSPAWAISDGAATHSTSMGAAIRAFPFTPSKGTVAWQPAGKSGRRPRFSRVCMSNSSRGPETASRHRARK